MDYLWLAFGISIFLMIFITNSIFRVWEPVAIEYTQLAGHRLSTVQHADNIIVLHNGIITEQGTHTELTQKRGEYYQLVKNQLELGN